MKANPTTAEALRRNEDVRHLVGRIAMAEGFHAIVVKCESFGLAQALIDVLRDDVSPLRDDPVHWEYIDPYVVHENLDEPIPARLLIDHVLERLLFPVAHARGKNVVTVLDGSRAMSRDEGAWQLLFQRMNERRNAIMRALSSVLLFIWPQHYALLFAGNAPDFWSICSSPISVQAHLDIDEALLFPLLTDAIASSERSKTVPDGRPKGLGALFPLLKMNDIEREIAQLRRRLVENPEDIKTDDALVFWLNKLAEVASQEQHYQLGIAVTKELVETSRKRIAKNPNDPGLNLKVALLLADMSRFLRPDDTASSKYIAEAVSLAQEATRVGIQDPTILMQALQVFEASGSRHVLHAEWDAARTDFEWSQTLAERLVHTEPGRVQWRKFLASSQHSLATVYQALGNLDLAVDAYEKSLMQWREAEKLGDGSLEIRRKKADTMRDLGMAHSGLKEWEPALDAYEESLATFRAALDRYPEDTRLLHGIVETSAAMVSVHAQCNDFDRAIAVAARASATIDRLLTRNENDVTARRCKGFFEFAHAVAYAEREQFLEATTHFRAALEMLEPLLATEPADFRVVDLVQNIRKRIQIRRDAEGS